MQEIGADTCKICCYTSILCNCRQPFGYAHRVTQPGYYMQDEHNSSDGNMENVYVADSAQGEGNGLFRPVRVHVRGHIDGLAGIGRGTTFVPAPEWPPTRFVFSRVPSGMGSRNCQQSPANDDSENRNDHNRDMSRDGLTALVGLSQGGSNTSNVNGEHIEQGYETDRRLSEPSLAAPSTSGISVQMLESPENSIGIEWENTNGSSISLDMKTPLSHFPPFRFG